jgi:hypothetical protein
MKQSDVFNLFKAGIDKCIASYPVLHEAIAIRTPFLGFAGEPLEIFVPKDGQITDGGATLNLFSSLRCYQDYLDWSFREDYLDRYNIREEKGNLICTATSPCGILRYAQGVAQLQTKFEAHPLGASDD